MRIVLKTADGWFNFYHGLINTNHKINISWSHRAYVIIINKTSKQISFWSSWITAFFFVCLLYIYYRLLHPCKNKIRGLKIKNQQYNEMFLYFPDINNNNLTFVWPPCCDKNKALLKFINLLLWFLEGFTPTEILLRIFSRQSIIRKCYVTVRPHCLEKAVGDIATNSFL